MRISLTVVGKVCQRVIDLAAHQILTISQTSNRLFICNEHWQRLSDFLRLRKSYYGVLFEFDSSDRSVLDEHEGLGRGYHEETVELFSNGEAVEAVTFIADSDAIDESLSPYTWYKDFVVEGAKQNSINSEYITYLEGFIALTDPDKSREERNRKILLSPL